MATIGILIGAGLLSYVVYLISGVGIAIMAGIGIISLMLVIRGWMNQIAHNMIVFHEIQCEMHRDTQYHLRRKN